jgi:hypothetical protein
MILVGSLLTGDFVRCLELVVSFVYIDHSLSLSDLQFKAGNITAEETVALLEALNTAVFDSSGASGNAYDPYSCNLNGLSTYTDCPFPEIGAAALFDWNIKASSSHHDHHPDTIRGVTLVGLLVPALWATNGAGHGFLSYEASDFTEMYNAGLNTVLIPVPEELEFWKSSHHHRSLTESDRSGPAFREEHSHHAPTHSSHADAPTHHKAAPHVTEIKRDLHLLFDVLSMARDAKLRVILQFVESNGKTASSLEHQKEVVSHALNALMDNNHASEVLLGVQLPLLGQTSEALTGYSALIAAARRASSHLPLFVPVNIGQLAQLKVVHPADEHIYTALSMDHTSVIADIASSSSLDDRMKLYYHENVACTQRSPIDYVACYKGQPALVTTGFDAAIDNCAFEADHTISFVDYGQCSRWEETVGSHWWERHRQSFLVRQLASFEQGLGWIFAAWKVSEDDDLSLPSGLITSPAQLHSFTAVSAAGIFPNLHSYVTGSDDIDDIPACLNPPLDDFILGDETLAPVPAPPPDCGNGWWNYTIQDCSYWVPPPPPPPCPVCEVCNETDEATGVVHHTHHHVPSLTNNDSSNTSLDALELDEMMSWDRHDFVALYGLHHVGLAFVAGVLMTTSVLGLWAGFMNYRNQRRRDGYMVISNDANL